MTGRIVCFGELLLRLSAPGRELLMQSPTLEARFAGAEANVAVALSRMGLKTAFVTIAPENNALGEASLDEVRRYGVDVSASIKLPGRQAIYFITQGAMMRASEILYDRANSAFALAPSDAINWDSVLPGADWLHVSGITPAVSHNAGEAALSAMKTARAKGVRISMDCNYRERIWKARTDDPRPVLAALMAEADLMFADPRDFELVLGESFTADDDMARRRAAAAIAFARFPNLKRIAATRRNVLSADCNELTGTMLTRDNAWTTRTYALDGIIDRIGGGDAFAAGLLYGLATGADDQSMLDYAVASAALKHATPGDFSLSSADDIRRAASDAGFEVRR